MLRVSIRATTETDVDAETESLRRAAIGSGLEPMLIDRIVDEAYAVTQEFVNRGRELKALGSQLKAERTIKGEGYDIRVSFDTTRRSGILERALAAFRR